jgi:hypothetical protein
MYNYYTFWKKYEVLESNFYKGIWNFSLIDK